MIDWKQIRNKANSGDFETMEELINYQSEHFPSLTTALEKQEKALKASRMELWTHTEENTSAEVFHRYKVPLGESLIVVDGLYGGTCVIAYAKDEPELTECLEEKNV